LITFTGRLNRGEVESHPAAAQIVRFGGRVIVHHRARIADRHHVVFPVLRKLLDVPHHLSCRHRRSGIDFPPFALAAGEDLDVGAADVDGQDIHGSACCSIGF
jgi:hypothetical protein